MIALSALRGLLDASILFNSSPVTASVVLYNNNQFYFRSVRIFLYKSPPPPPFPLSPFPARLFIAPYDYVRSDFRSPLINTR